MHYTEYCQAQSRHQGAPLENHDFYQEFNQLVKNRSTVLADIQQVSVNSIPKYFEVVQRCFDVLLSCLGLVIGAIPFLTIAIAIKIDSAGAVFYRQKRVGKGGKVFQMIKFRTMRQDAERMTGAVWSGDNDPRVTRVGAFLRKVRLDEMPQLFNILKGQMTFVGPRPERPEFVYQFIQYMPAFDRRHDVKPGIAGLAQMMNGYDNSSHSIYRKLRWDAEYMRRKCLMMDFFIFYRTVRAVLKGTV